ncbi:MAG: nucleotidyltransferase domain-containing protein [Candidatus Firestonebacteria bacterium]|nr:nucleotidyltransferase domain-containing protein [Candidatus Firestonebacteria bacterium]
MILFGSYAGGNINENSDIDIIGIINAIKYY